MSVEHELIRYKKMHHFTGLFLNVAAIIISFLIVDYSSYFEYLSLALIILCCGSSAISSIRIINRLSKELD